ncbi:MAG: anthranilate synthase component I [Brevinematia bacterium]
MKVVISERTLPGDIETPVSIYLKLKDLSLHSFLLESVIGNEIVGRYSFIGTKPFLIFKASKKDTNEKGKSVAEYNIEGFENLTEITEDPFMVIQNLSESEVIVGSGNPFEIPFYGGAVGYLSYDTIRYIERIPDKNPDTLNLPEFYFILPSILICFDNISKFIKVISIEPVVSYQKEALQTGIRKIEEVIEKIREPLSFQSKVLPKTNVEYRSNFKKEEFIKIVEKAKKYIEEGDIFQVVLSQRLSFELNADSFDVYRKLRMINPSPYMYYLNFGDITISGSSPEMLVKLWNGILETRPIAGTRPRGKTLEEDKVLEKELLSDQKELAEHTMLVDLARNDLGRISEFGSVKVEEYMVVEKYSHVMHIVSSVKGKLRQDIKPMEVMKNVFPAGTVSGAPKVRAMEIIDELENIRRGPYAGTVMYLGFNGNMDSAITLRTMIAKGNKVYVQAGAGIVYDSSPESEYNETLNKAKAVIKAVEMASKGE